MTEEQEKYIIEKYPYFFDGAMCGTGFCALNSSAFTARHKGFSRYINMSLKLFKVEEKEQVMQCLLEKTYQSMQRYNTILRKVGMVHHPNSHNVVIKHIAYFLDEIETYNDFVAYCSFGDGCITFETKPQEREKIIRERKKDALLVFEIIRPDITANACMKKDREMLLENYARLDKILNKYNKFVFYTKAAYKVEDFIIPQKREQVRLLINLLLKNKYIKRNNHRYEVNEEYIAKSTFNTIFYQKVVELDLCKMNIHKSRFLYTFSYIDNKKDGWRFRNDATMPFRLQKIFDEVAKYDNKSNNK